MARITYKLGKEKCFKFNIYSTARPLRCATAWGMSSYRIHKRLRFVIANHKPLKEIILRQM